MKRHQLTVGAIVFAGVLVLAGCGRQSRGNSDAHEQSRAASPEEGGNISTAGSAGQAKNFGDTARSGASEAVTPPDHPKQFTTRESNEPTHQPRKSTDEPRP